MIFLPYITKFLLINKAMFTTQKGLVLFPIAVSMPFILTNETKAIFLLLLLMIIDFLTGIGASFSRIKKARKLNPSLPKTNIITSKKLKGSGVKFLLYFSSILVAFAVQYVFQINAFKIPTIGLEFNTILFIIAFWCIVEIYSIFFENFKDMGMDIKIIIRKITNLITFIKDKSDKICETDNNKENGM